VVYDVVGDLRDFRFDRSGYQFSGDSSAALGMTALVGQAGSSKQKTESNIIVRGLCV